MVYGEKTVRMVACWLVPGILAVPFVANFYGGLMGGFCPWVYLSSIPLAIMILIFNSGNALLGFLSFWALLRRRNSLMVSLIPSIVGAGVMAYFNFCVNPTGDPQAVIAIIIVPFFAIPCFVVPWILIALVGRLTNCKR